MDQLTSAQLSEWEAYDRLDPIGKWRDDYSFAVLNALIINIVNKLYGKGKTKQYTPVDFIPNWSGEKKPVKTQSIEDMKQALLNIAKSANTKKRRIPVTSKTAKKPPIVRSKPNQTKK